MAEVWDCPTYPNYIAMVAHWCAIRWMKEGETLYIAEMQWEYLYNPVK